MYEQRVHYTRHTADANGFLVGGRIVIAVAEVRINMVMRSLSEPLGTRRRQKVKSKVKQRFVNKFIVQISVSTSIQSFEKT